MSSGKRGRPRVYPGVSDQEALLRFLRAVHDMPWAMPDALSAYTGLFNWEIVRWIRPRCLETGWIERAVVRVPSGRAPVRLALTSLGASILQTPWSLALASESLMRCHNLDVARRMIGDWARELGRVRWALTPFSLPLGALRSQARRLDPATPFDPQRALAPLRFDALCSVEVGTTSQRRHVALAVWVDPGDIQMSWWHTQLRSLAAWRRRPEFERRGECFPIVVLIMASEQRQGEMVRLWRESAGRVYGAVTLRLTTLRDLIHSHASVVWRGTSREPASLLAGVIGHRHPLPRPVNHVTGWWGGGGQLEKPAASPVVTRRPGGLVAHAQIDSLSGLLRQARIQLTLTARERWLVVAVGNYPLLTARDLALILNLDISHVRQGLRQLQELGLVDRDDDQRVWLTWIGVSWTAAQAGIAPELYARLRRWPTKRDSDGAKRLETHGLLVQAVHTRSLIELMTAIKAGCKTRGLTLEFWDQMTPLQRFGEQDVRIVPDALATVTRRGRGGTVTQCWRFWLEVDRGTICGRHLTQKLRRYYQVGGPRRGWLGRSERVLIVVRDGGEGRLRHIQRQLVALDEVYHTRLDVRLARWDQVFGPDGQVDLTRRVWRGTHPAVLLPAIDLGA